MHFEPLPKITVPNLPSTSVTRKWAAKSYAGVKGVVECPLGNVLISNYAWRHLTRVTRTQSHIADSLTALPYVKQFLKRRPHQIQTVSEKREIDEKMVKINRKVLAIYRDIRFSDKGTCLVYVRLDERIVYPRSWQERGLFREGVTQELRLESIYRKPKSD